MNKFTIKVDIFLIFCVSLLCQLSHQHGKPKPNEKRNIQIFKAYTLSFFNPNDAAIAG